jgi:hypothetical protein
LRFCTSELSRLDARAQEDRAQHPPVLRQGEEGPPRDGVHRRQILGGPLQPRPARQRAAHELPGVDIIILFNNCSIAINQQPVSVTR